jgi:iron complex transport system ATP-binding protein
MLVVAVTHDLNLAAAYAPRLILMNRGLVHADGAARDVMQSRLIEDVFEVRVEMHQTPAGNPWMLYGE